MAASGGIVSEGAVAALFSEWASLFLASEDVYKDHDAASEGEARVHLDGEANALHAQMMAIEDAILNSDEAPSPRAVFCKLSLAWALARRTAQPETPGDAWEIVRSALVDMRRLTEAPARAE